MNSSKSADSRREQAIALRRAGKSRREIKEILGVGSNQTLNELLSKACAGLEPPTPVAYAHPPLVGRGGSEPTPRGSRAGG